MRTPARFFGLIHRPTHFDLDKILVNLPSTLKQPGLFRHYFLIGLVASVALLNQAQSKTLQEFQAFLDVPNEQLVKALETIGRFTPTINEDSTAIERATLGQGTDLMIKQDFAKTLSVPISYTIQKGDTYSTIAKKFNITVATILEANKIDPKEVNHLSPGQTLVIPPEITSNSLAWLDEINQAREEEKKRELAKKRLALAHRSTATRDSSSRRQEATAPEGGEGYITPLNYNYLSRGISRGHAGLDLIAPHGQPVWAAQDCKVTRADSQGWNGGFGKLVVCQDAKGNSAYYAHLSEVLVNEGEVVTQGQTIGKVGSSGRSTGDHLHFEVRSSSGSAINPLGR